MKVDGKRWFFDEFGGLWEVFCGSRGLLETCLGDLGGLLWIRGGFYGLLRGLWCGFGCPWRSFGGLLGGFGWTFGSLWVAGGCFFGACVGKRESMKSVVLLREMEVPKSATLWPA